MVLKHKLINAFIATKTKEEYHDILLTWNFYYKDLSTFNQNIFLVKTYIFLKSTYFNSQPGFLIDNRMKVIISSAFAQITFGLKTDKLSIFKTLFITPQPYSYKNNSALFNGDVNLYTKTVNLTWPVVEEGFKISDDALNLAIHEFGHCLIIENSKRSYFSRIFNETALNKWKTIAKNEIIKIHTNKPSVLRDYGGTNLMELFSVCLETFFEKSDYFYTNSPELFLSTCELLNQNPLKKDNAILK